MTGLLLGAMETYPGTTALDQADAAGWQTWGALGAGALVARRLDRAA
ncbi:MAG: hypothetical protein ABIQ59_05285 [Nocardioidaceae bacterium]